MADSQSPYEPILEMLDRFEAILKETRDLIERRQRDREADSDG